MVKRSKAPKYAWEETTQATYLDVQANHTLTRFCLKAHCETPSK